MSAENNNIQNTTTAFSFVLKIGGKDCGYFQEVSGLDLQTQNLEYRHGDNAAFSEIKMPEIVKHTNLTLKRGVAINNNSFQKWVETLNSFSFKRETMVLELLDNEGKPIMSWTLSNAYPTKMKAENFSAEKKEITLEELEICYEEVVVNIG